jgi:hypothetical protein
MLLLPLARSFAALLLLLSLIGGVAQAEPIDQAHAEPIDWSKVDPAQHTFDHWYLDTIECRPAGYWRSAMTVEGETITTLYHEHSVESHGGELSTYSHVVVWVETTNFKPLSITTITSAGSDEVKKTYRFVDDGIELTSEQNGKSIQRKLPSIKGDYLTAAQSAIANDLYLKQGRASFEINTLDIDVGLTPYRTTMARQGEQASTFTRADGSEAKVWQWRTTYSVFPGFVMKSWIDESNNLVGLEYEIDGMAFASRLSDEKVVETDFDPPEMSGLSVVVPDRPIKDVEKQRKIVYELNYAAGEKPVVPITTVKQSVQALGKGKARVTVDLSAKPQPAEDKPAEKYLASSIMVDHEDKLVRKLAKKAIAELKDGASDQQIAMACKRFVSQHVSGASLSVGDGSASQAARTKEGDCTECSVLLAALLRVHGIPSRCVNGLVYSEDDFVGQQDVFVYHMWTQAWIETEDGKGHWLDLDSAMWRYSAGHLALGTSAMGDDDQQDMINIVPMQHDLAIKVIETSP